MKKQKNYLILIRSLSCKHPSNYMLINEAHKEPNTNNYVLYCSNKIVCLQKNIHGPSQIIFEKLNNEYKTKCNICGVLQIYE